MLVGGWWQGCWFVAAVLAGGLWQECWLVVGGRGVGW